MRWLSDPPQNSCMTSKRRASERAVNLLVEPPRDAVVVPPAPSLLSRLVARLKTLKGAIVAIAGAGAMLGGLAGYWNAYQAARSSTQTTQLLALVGKGDAGPLSIVVLPFANLTGDPQQAYVADGLTAAVTADLSRIRDAFIVSAATAFAYKDKAVTVQQIGRELGVRFALQGGMQRSDEKIRINAQLADTTTNAQLWSESFDGSQGDLFALQEMVTARIGNSIGREMVIVAARESERKSNAKAVDLMLRAKALGLKPVSPKSYEEEQALYRQALLLEPNNIQALVRLAVVLSRQVENGFVADPLVREKQLMEARDLALKAKEIDASVADIYFALGVCAMVRGDDSESRRYLEHALSLDPMNPIRYNSLAVSHFNFGEPTRAVEILTQGIRLDPRHVNERLLINMGRAQFMLGDDAAAISWLLKALDANPNRTVPHAYLAMAYARRGHDAKSREATATLLRLDPTFSFSNHFPMPDAGSPEAYRIFWGRRLLPAGRLAGLPE